MNKNRITKIFIITLISILIINACKIGTTTNSNYTVKDLKGQYTVQTVGNSFPANKIFSRPYRPYVQQNIGPYRRHVQQNVADLFVTPNGICLTNSTWDERFALASAYKDGDQTVIMENMMGWGRRGGLAVTADNQNQYVYVGIKIRNIGRTNNNKYDNPVYPPSGNIWYGFRRYDAKTGKVAEFPQGYGFQGGVVVVNTNDGHINGLAINKNLLYVSDTPNNGIKVYDLNNLSQQAIATWTVDNPGKLAFDGEGNLWVVKNQTNQILRFSIDGQQMPQTITLPEGVIAYDLAIDKINNTLYVTDIGQDQNIKIYNNIVSEPKLQQTFGLKGGIFASNAGKLEDLKFHNPKGIGIDANGNLYIAQKTWSSKGGGGIIISSYQPNGNLQWRLSSSEFMSGLDLDVENKQFLYSKERRYNLTEDTKIHFSTTLNPFEFPQDPRLHEHFTDVRVNYLNDKQMLFLSERNGKTLAVYRFQPETHQEIAIPYAMFSGSGNRRWIPNQPKKKKWLWIDSNLNGQFERDEFTVDPKKTNKSTDWFIESDGNLWTVNSKTIRKFPTVYNEGYPEWNFNNVQEFNIPKPFTSVKRLAYDRATDSMYLTGYTSNHPYEGNWKAIGKVMARFDNWSIAPKLNWILDTPWQTHSKDGRQKPITFALEGDYIFIGIGSTGKQKNLLEQSTILVYDKLSRKYIGSMQQGNKIGPVMLDKGQGLNVRKISDREYWIFLQDAAYARSVIFKWNPQKNIQYL